MTQPTSHTPQRRSSAGRVVATVAGVAVGLVALALVVGGGVLLWGTTRKDDDGYITTKAQRFHTPTSALATQNLDVDGDVSDVIAKPDRYGKIRLKATAHDRTPLFVGIARTGDVAAYLRGTSHATVADLDYDPFRVDYRTHPGARRPASPAGRSFWVASAHGSGTQTVTWDVRHGAWSIVVMKPDGSPGVDARVSAGANLPWLSALAWGTLGTGIVLLIGAAGLVTLGVRARPRREPEQRDTPDATPATA